MLDDYFRAKFDIEDAHRHFLNECYKMARAVIVAAEKDGSYTNDQTGALEVAGPFISVVKTDACSSVQLVKDHKVRSFQKASMTELLTLYEALEGMLKWFD